MKLDIALSASPSGETETPSATALVVDDSEGLRRSLAAVLEDSGVFTRVHTASDGFSAIALLKRTPVDIVLCDMHMNHCDGLQFLGLKSADPALAGIPVIMLSGDDNVATMVAALECGAQDYVSKAALPVELSARLNVHLRLKRATDELNCERAKLELLSRQDPLTGLSNRRNLDELLEREVARSVRYDRPMSVIMMDLDHFKGLNDRYGHQAGDHVLREAARVLQRTVRRHDLLARYGGEELAIVMPETSLEQAAVAAERLRIALATAEIVWRGEQLRITASFGVVGTSRMPLRDSQELVRLADRALYRAKVQGRNRVSLARPDSNPLGSPTGIVEGS